MPEPVRNSSTGKAFDRGVIHVPDTAYPWDGEDPKKGTWVADTLVGRDLLTLQTYTLPNSEDRLVVRADRVEPNPARENKRR